MRFESVDRGHRNDLERRQFEADMAALGIDVAYSGEPEKQAPQFRKLQRGIKGVQILIRSFCLSVVAPVARPCTATPARKRSRAGARTDIGSIAVSVG